MIDLALQDTDSPVSRQDIAQRQDISIHYLEQLLVRLRRAGLVESVRGPGGGYRLAREPERIRVSEIVVVVEGPIALAPCLENKTQPVCPRVLECAAHRLWRSITEQIVEALGAVTLADLCQQAQNLSAPRREH
jgi:Rrf2 family protein